MSGRDIRWLIKDESFDSVLNLIEKCLEVISYFLGKNREPNYQESVKNILQYFNIQAVNMSFKIHFLMSHLDFLRPQMSNISDEPVKRFHQTILSIEHRYKRKINEHRLADFVGF